MSVIRLSIITLLISFASHFCAAQNESNVWHFGDHCGLDFNTSGPLAIPSPLYNLEGSASICNSNGQLLFFTNGVYVWDRNNNLMPNGNGLLGAFSSTQSALICPAPNDVSKYYVFTCDQEGGPNMSVHYSIVDMTLNAGLGDVSVLNVLLLAGPATEKLTAIRHCNGTDFWIVTHPFNSDAFNCYLLTATGVNATPVVSNVGSSHYASIGVFNAAIGYMKASPNSQHLAVANYGQHFVECFDFDANTGVVSNPLTINYPWTESPYGISFSPNSKILYVSTIDDSTSRVYQYDISSGSQWTIIGTETLIHQTTGFQNSLGALQIGPDHRLYISKYGTAALDRIDFPNLQGPTCSYVPSAVSLTGSGRYGLPNCIDAFTGSCSDSIVNDPDEPFIPNVFTPNNDGINDVFLIVTGIVSRYELNIYNRWGNILFTTTLPNTAWDGTANTVLVSEGTYYWTLSYTTANGNRIERSGFFQLIR